MENNSNKYKREYYRYINCGHYTHALLFEFRRSNSPAYVQKLLSSFCSFVNRDYLGPRKGSMPERFIPMFALPERQGLNFHYHAVIAVPDEYRKRFESVAPLIWKQVGEEYCNEERPVCGNFDQKRLLSRTDQKKFIWYIFKQFHRNPHDWFISPQFRPVSANELRKRRPARRPSGLPSKFGRCIYGPRPNEPVEDI